MVAIQVRNGLIQTGNFPDPVIAGIGNNQIAHAIGSHSPQSGKGSRDCRTPVSGKARRTVGIAGDRGYDCCRCDLANSVVACIGQQKISVAVQVSP